LNTVLRRLSGSSWLVFAVAVAVRLIYLIQYRESVFYLAPIMDAADYHGIAVSLSHGKVIPTLAFRAPLYPLFLGLVYLVFGVGELIPRLFQIAVGAGSCVMVKHIAERLYGRGIGTIAGVIAATTGLMVYFDLELLPTSLFLFLNLSFVRELILLKADEGSAVKAGVYLALAILTRPVVLPFLPIAILLIYIYRRETVDLLKFTASATLPLIASLLVHIAVGSGPVLVSAQGGVNYYIGNHHQADGASAAFPGMGTGWGWEDVSRWAEARAGRQLTDAETDRTYWREGLREVGNHPGRWIKLMIRKALLFWNRAEIPNNRDFYYHGRRFPLIALLMNIGFPLLLPFAFCGIVLGWKRAEVKLITLFIVVFFLTAIQFFVAARFRHPLTPFLIVLAVGGIVQTAWMIAARRGGVKVWALVAAAFMAGLILPRLATYGRDFNDASYGLLSEGNAYKSLGRYEEAEEFYRKALAANSGAPFVNYYIAELARRQGRLRQAVEYYRRELELRPGYARGWNNLGVTLVELDQENEALICFKRALTEQPEMIEAARNAARIYGRRALELAGKGDWGSAAAYLDKALEYQPDEPLFRTMRLEARYRLGDDAGIREELRKLLARHPGFQPAVQLLDEIER